jgi:cysteine synthase A
MLRRERAPQVCADISAAIGNTPLVRLRRASERAGCTILGKCEFMNPGVVVALADPMGAAMYSWFKHGVLASEGSSVTEGIGQGRVTGNVEGARVDEAFQVPDAEALPLLFDLLEEEGICVGGSSAINLAGAIRLAHELGPGHTIVTLLCDHGSRYATKLFDPEFLTSRGLPLPPRVAR